MELDVVVVWARAGQSSGSQWDRRWACGDDGRPGDGRAARCAGLIGQQTPRDCLHAVRRTRVGGETRTGKLAWLTQLPGKHRSGQTWLLETDLCLNTPFLPPASSSPPPRPRRPSRHARPPSPPFWTLHRPSPPTSRINTRKIGGHRRPHPFPFHPVL